MIRPFSCYLRLFHWNVRKSKLWFKLPVPVALRTCYFIKKIQILEIVPFPVSAELLEIRTLLFYTLSIVFQCLKNASPK